MDTILVTGGAGFIGSHLVNRLSDQNKIIIIDNLQSGKRSNIDMNENIVFLEEDIGNISFMEEVFETYSFQYIYHFAAIASVAQSVENPGKTFKTNLFATVNLLENVLKHSSLKRFIFASSAAVYGDDLTLPKSEKSNIKPITPYAIDKYASERYTIAFNQLYNINTTAVRFFNVYGPKQNPDSPYSGVISILTKALRDRKEGKNSSFYVYGEGDQTRDFVYIDDLIEALLLVSKDESAIGETYNIGTGIAVSLNKLIETYKNVTGIELPVIYKEIRKGDIKDSYSDISKLNKIGYRPAYSMERGLSAYWEAERI